MPKKKKIDNIDNKGNTYIYNEFNFFTQWFNKQGLRSIVEKNKKFDIGEQWHEPTERTINFPRPIINIYNNFVSVTKGNILSSPVNIRFIGVGNKEKCKKLSDVCQYLRKEAQEEFYDEWLVDDALLAGTGYMYYFFSEDAIGKQGKYKGALRMEVIDVEDVALADPNSNDLIQNQKWIIVRSRVDVDVAKEMCSKEEDKELIEKEAVDKTLYEYNEELEDSNKIYIYTKMKKVDGEVYFAKATKNVLIHDYKPANSRLVNVKDIQTIIKESEDGYTKGDSFDINQDSTLEINKDYNGRKFYLYPIDDLKFVRKSKSFLGLPKFNDIITSQEGINTNFGLAELNNLQMAAPKYVVKENALQGQIITNKVGDTIIDHTPAGQKGIDILQGSPITASGLQIASSTVELLRVVKGINDVVTGETPTNETSGYATNIRANQAQKPIALMQRAYWRHKEREAEIIAQFVILNYNEETEYTYKNSFANITQQMAIDPNNVQRGGVGTFIGSEFEGFDYETKAQASAGTQFSQQLLASNLSALFQAGTLRPEYYIQLMPDELMPDKDEILDVLMEQNASIINQQQQQIQGFTNQMQQVSQYAKGLESERDEYKRNYKDIQAQLKRVGSEYAKKINQANTIIQDQQNAMVKKEEEYQKRSEKQLNGGKNSK